MSSSAPTETNPRTAAPKASALIDIRRIDFTIENVGEDLKPQFRSREVAADPYFLRRTGDIRQRQHDAVHPVANAFEGRPDYVGGGVAERQAKQNSARIGVPVGRPLAREKGQHDEAVGATGIAPAFCVINA